MTAWAPQIVKIEKVEHHPNADVLDIVHVLGDHPVIAKRDEYKVNDLAGYIQIDSIVPDTDQFSFLCPKAYEQYEEDGIVKQRQVGPKYQVGETPERYRVIKAKKLRNIFSMGLLVPPPPGLSVGDSIVEILELKKWEELVDDNVGPTSFKTRGANAAPAPKGWSIPYYDLESVRKYIPCVEQEQDIILTEKINGSNSGFCYDGSKLVIKSRNYYKKDDPDDMWVEVAIRHQLEEKFSRYPMIAFFAEVTGQVKSFKYDAEILNGKLNTKLYFFDAFDVSNNKYLDHDDFIAIMKDLCLETAPILYRGPWLDKAQMYAYAEGKSVLDPKTIREGWALSLGKERFEPKLGGRLKLKYISEGYNLAK